MKILDSLLGRRDFYSRDDIARYIVRSKNYDSSKESSVQAKTFLFFETAEQRTWLVATPHRLYCILDDVRKPEPNINWSMSREKIFSGDALNLQINTKEKGNRTGLLDIGPTHKNWLYTKALFLTQPVTEAITEFIKDSMQTQ